VSVATPRLRGEPAGSQHAAHCRALFADPAVAATLWPGALGGARTPSQAAALARADGDCWAEHGFGPWAFFETVTSRFAGRGGLQPTEVGGRSSVEVLYAVASPLWGRGYATEMARAAVAFARELGLPEVVGFTLTTNVASQRVLQHAGLTFERELEHAGLPHRFGRLVL
jgi:[ribosomal protein S5]-alanine N-acetyltransferase